jgi:hypothetical protein
MDNLLVGTLSLPQLPAENSLPLVMSSAPSSLWKTLRDHRNHRHDQLGIGDHLPRNPDHDRSESPITIPRNPQSDPVRHGDQINSLLKNCFGTLF